MNDPALQFVQDHLDQVLTSLIERRAHETEVMLNGMALTIKALVQSLEDINATAHNLGNTIIALLQNAHAEEPRKLTFDFADITETHIRDMLIITDRIVSDSKELTTPMIEIINPSLDAFAPSDTKEEPKSRKSPYIPDGSKYP